MLVGRGWNYSLRLEGKVGIQAGNEAGNEVGRETQKVLEFFA